MIPPRSFALLLALMLSLPLRADVILSEFLADNEDGIADETGTQQDWIELFNTGDEPVNLDGWWLTDKSNQKTQWRFPAVTLQAKSTLLVWASGEDRRDPAAPLHTNFSLAKGGEYLGLYRPNPENGQPLLASDFGTAYPPQAPDVSYGPSISQTTASLVASGETGRYRVPANNVLGAADYTGTDYAAGQLGTHQAGGWNVSAAFDDSGWTAGATGIGYDTGGSLSPWIGANCQNALRNANTSLCFRRTFTVADPSSISVLTLRMKYEDGFVAWLNGVEIGRANFSGATDYHSVAATALDEAIVNSWTEIAIPRTALVAGANVLAIQGLNSSLSSSDFLLLPEITATTSFQVGTPVYFSTPTPGALNNTGTAGPVLYDATPVDPEVPRPLGNATSPPLTVTVRALRTRNPIAAVRAFHRTQFAGESAAIPLNDSGVAPDATAGDGIWSGSLPTTGPQPGQMLRWRFEAADSAGAVTLLPAYTDPADSPKYFGTVAVSGLAAQSQLPVMEWFVEGAPFNGPTASEFRGCCYYLKRFYDNTRHEIHGQSTAGFTKKSYDFDSNDGNRFTWKEGEAKVKDLNLLSNYADKTKLRNTLSHEIGMLAGTPYHFAFPVRVHLNGGFHGVMDLVEDGDDRMLERNGLDPAGALYKIYSETPASGPEKKTRKQEDNSDIQALTDALDPNAHSLAERLTWGYDNLDLPATVNYLVVRQFNSDRDHGHKNYYLYRDSNRTREWRPIVWDVDLSYGHNYNDSEGYFDDDLIANNPLNAHSSNNRVYNLVLETPELRAMWLRRMRTLMDLYLQPPGTTNGFLETRMRQWVATIDPDPANPSPGTDGDLDASRWGISSAFLANKPREEVERLIGSYLPARRNFLYNTSGSRPLLVKPGSSGGDPLPAAPQINAAGMVTIDSLDYLPASGNQNEEYLILRNNLASAVDLSGWRLEGGIDHVFEGGTVIPAGAGTAGIAYRGLLHVVKNTVAFRARLTGPKGGQKRLIQGDYSGQLSARGEEIRLLDGSGQIIATYRYPGTPTPLQQALRISEIQYHPADPTAAEALAVPGAKDDDFEYLEFINTGETPLPLAGVKFSQGIGWTFPAHTLAAGDRLILAKNPAAFAVRYPAVTAAVLGPYEGDLDNGGERLELTDPLGENILDFEYKDGWYPATDGPGRSLAIRDPAIPFDDYGDAVSWAISAPVGGSPGAGDPGFAQAYYGWDNFHFNGTERDDPALAGPAADPDGDGRSNVDEYALGTDPRKVDAPVTAFVWADGFPALSFRRPENALDVSYALQASGDLETWEDAPATMGPAASLGGGVETVVLRETTPTSTSKRFLRLRYLTAP